MAKPEILVSDHELLPEERVCALCHKGEDSMQLHHLCDCKFVMHKACLEVTLMDTDHDRCEMCGRKYDLLWLPRYSRPRGLWQYLCSKADHHQMLLVLLYSALLTPNVVLSVLFIRDSRRETEQAAALRESGEYWYELMDEPQHYSWIVAVTAMMVAGYAGLLLTFVTVNLLAFNEWYPTTFLPTITTHNPVMHPAPHPKEPADQHKPQDKPQDQAISRSQDKLQAQDKSRSQEKLPAQDKSRSQEKLPAQDKTRSQEKLPAQDKTRSQEKLPAQDKTRSQEKIPAQEKSRSQDKLQAQDKPK
ncbi:uncharacterized protein LOC134531436 [Bacillus rossius redtenbacheri]|uniref:uncharacterized protein LOC134531436 n=1 Tax=Bacillus rossius redtenbacheri TaxID=93214 RepID=UPI002FDEA3B7